MASDGKAGISLPTWTLWVLAAIFLGFIAWLIAPFLKKPTPPNCTGMCGLKLRGASHDCEGLSEYANLCLDAFEAYVVDGPTGQRWWKETACSKLSGWTVWVLPLSDAGGSWEMVSVLPDGGTGLVRTADSVDLQLMTSTVGTDDWGTGAVCHSFGHLFEWTIWRYDFDYQHKWWPTNGIYKSINDADSLWRTRGLDGGTRLDAGR